MDFSTNFTQNVQEFLHDSSRIFQELLQDISLGGCQPYAGLLSFWEFFSGFSGGVSLIITQEAVNSFSRFFF